MQAQIDNMLHGGCVKRVTKAMIDPRANIEAYLPWKRVSVRSNADGSAVAQPSMMSVISPVQLHAATSPRSAGPDDAC